MLEKQALSTKTTHASLSSFVPNAEPEVQKWHPRIPGSMNPRTRYLTIELGILVTCPHCDKPYRIGDGIIFSQSWDMPKEYFDGATVACSPICLLAAFPPAAFSSLM